MKIVPNWLIGVFLALLSTAVGSLGKVMIRCVYLIETSKAYPEYLQMHWSRFPFVSSFLLHCPVRILSFISQFLIIVLNPVLSVFSYSFAAQSMLTPFAGLSIVWSLFFSSHLLPETVDDGNGCLLISLSATHTPTSFTVEDLTQLSRQPSSILFNTVYAVLTLFLLSVILLQSRDRLQSYRGLAFGLLSGVLSGNQTYIKCLGIIISDFLKGIPVFTIPWVYYCLIMVGVTAGGGIIALNAGLKRYEAMYIIPLYQGSFIIIGSISGILFFNEMQTATFLQIAVYIAGICLNLIGLNPLPAAMEEIVSVEADSVVRKFPSFSLDLSFCVS
ncbi:hypothetical protein WA171_006546 [Blastocystis sp. BT1]